jgi:opacity protein-like surface antigen
MPVQTKTLGFLATALLLAALLAEPFPAEAANGGVKIDLRLHGGYSYLSAGDVNTGSGGYFEFYKLLADYSGWAYEGGYKPVHAGYDAGVDVVFLLSPRVGIGVGAGYLRSSGSAEMTLVPETDEMVFNGGPTLSAIPIRLGLYYSLPLGGKLSLTANAGAAFYAGLRFEDRFHVEQSGIFSTQEIVASRWSLSANLGFQGGLGLDYKISSKMGFFIEAQGRYARFKNFGKATIKVASSEGGSQTREGKIYLRTQTLSADPLIVFNAFVVQSTPPSPDPPDLVISEPKFDLSGFCLQAGFRIRI